MQGTPELFKLLGQIDPEKPYGTELFNALARLTLTVAVEAVCLRQIDQTTQVYLVQRSLTESAYPGEWHCPGSIFRMGEELEDVFARLEAKEFCCKLATKQFIANINNPQEVRGHGFSVVYLCTKDGNFGHGTWFWVHDLPKTIIDFHRDKVIPIAVKNFHG